MTFNPIVEHDKETKSKWGVNEKDSAQMCKVINLMDHFFDQQETGDPLFYDILRIFFIPFGMQKF